MDIKNKTIFITGASSGIGMACAKIFAEKGAKLILGARRLQRLHELSNELEKKHGTKSCVLQLDISNRKMVEDTVDRLPPNWGDVDILINNAGLARGMDKFQDGNIDDWECMIDTNVKGLLYVTKALLPRMIKKNQGHIINVGSIGGREIYPAGNVYSATKHAVFALTKSLKLDLLGTGLRVTIVDPGMVETEFSEIRFDGNKDRARETYKGIKPLSGENIADAIFYCATCPDNVNISEMVLMPVAQASAVHIHRELI